MLVNLTNQRSCRFANVVYFKSHCPFYQKSIAFATDSASCASKLAFDECDRIPSCLFSDAVNTGDGI